MGDLSLCGRSEVSITEMSCPKIQSSLVCWKSKAQRGMMPGCIGGIFYATQPEIGLEVTTKSVSWTTK